jgi:nucleotide-binding universal stress UspA family protein
MTSAATSPVHYPARILCATDFSDFSRRALEYAVALARPVRGEITLLHVLLLPLPSVNSDDEPDWMPPGPGPRSELLERMRRFAAPAEAAGVTIRSELRDGLPGDEIVRAARTMDADLIVMGSHGRRGLGRVLGSHAERVLRTAPCPVLLACRSVDATPAEAPVRIQEVLCAASGSKHSPRTLDYAQCLAAGAGAHLTLLHVTEPGLLRTPPVPPWSGRIPPRPDQVAQCLSYGSPRSEILRCAQERRADLIVMGAHDRGPGALGYLGSTASHVASAAGRAVLAVKATPSPVIAADSPGDTVPVEVNAGGKR